MNQSVFTSLSPGFPAPTPIPSVGDLVFSGRDLTGDGRDDIVAVNTATAKVYWTANRSTWVTMPLAAHHVAFGDFDGDGTADLAACHATTGAVLVSTNGMKPN